MMAVFKLWIQIFLYTLITGIFFVWVIAAILYGFAWGTLIYTFNFILENRATFAATFFAGGFFIALWMLDRAQKQLKSRANCTVQTITLEQLSKVWLPAERQEEEMRAKIADEVNEELEMRQLILASIEFRLKASYSFFDLYVRPNLRYIQIKELVVIRDLILILEKEGGIPSVANKFANPTDSETVRFDAEFRGDMTSYEIYEQYSLYDHSLRVGRKMLRELEMANKEFNLGWQFRIGKALVIALAHDIGKIETIKHLNISAPEGIRKIKDHSFVSQIMFEEIFYDYEEVREMGELIANHHTTSKDLDRLGVILTKADKEARMEEMDIWNESRRNGTQYNDNFGQMPVIESY